MDEFSIKINDLPDEILTIILRKLFNVEVLYSLIGVNKRLNAIAHDSIFTNDLTLFQCSSDDSIHPLPDSILDRFLSEILPEIHHRIKSLNLEFTSMANFLLATNYPSLNGLGLFGIDVEKAISLFTDNTIFTHIIQNEILSFVIDISQNKKQIVVEDMSRIVFTHIFNTFTNLQYLKLGPSMNWYQELSFGISHPTVFSSTLLELHVSVTSFTDCLYLLDGRFNQLRTFRVNICRISSSTLAINNEDELPNLKCFSLYCYLLTHVYDELIVPLLQRMLNLEKLDLNLKVDRRKVLVDANDLKETIINYMPRLNKFTFDIRSFNRLPILFNLLSNEAIQHIFKDCTDNRIICWADYFPEEKFSYCHIYSYPYRLTYYENITNNFPGGLFNFVVKVSLYDQRPFEHEFFLRIAQSFPFIKQLTVVNRKPQKNKLHDGNKDFSMIKYPYLTTLSLIEAHDDYIEQFLVDIKMCLPNNVRLFVNYKSLEKVTDNFKRDVTRVNCAKVIYMCTILRYGCGNFRFPGHFRDYFLHVNTDII